jgi:hypothetical protein
MIPSGGSDSGSSYDVSSASMYSDSESEEHLEFRGMQIVGNDMIFNRTSVV